MAGAARYEASPPSDRQHSAAHAALERNSGIDQSRRALLGRASCLGYCVVRHAAASGRTDGGADRFHARGAITFRDRALDQAYLAVGEAADSPSEALYRDRKSTRR